MIKDKRDKDHRIALLKRRAKAYKQAGLDVTELKTEENKLGKPKQQHQTRKPDPVNKLVAKANQQRQDLEEKRKQAEEDRKKREQLLANQKLKRQHLNKIHSAKTRKGQPKLSSQIGLLLDKIQKRHDNK